MIIFYCYIYNRKGDYMNNGNYKWLVHGVYDSILVSLFYLENDNLVLYGNYDVLNIMDVVNQEINVKFANIDDITNLLTMGMVRFINIIDYDEIIDIPINKMAILYENAISLNEEFDKDKIISLSSLNAFSIIDGTSKKDGYYIGVTKIKELEDDLLQIFDIARDFGNMDMQGKFNALEDTNMINYRRVNKL